MKEIFRRRSGPKFIFMEIYSPITNLGQGSIPSSDNFEGVEPYSCGYLHSGLRTKTLGCCTAMPLILSNISMLIRERCPRVYLLCISRHELSNIA